MTRYYFGISDEQFLRGSTPRSSIVVDIGAGTGSMSVEAARAACDGRVYAIEREKEGIELIKQNAAKFGVNNLYPVFGAAPDALVGLPPADVILVGGSGGKLDSILTCCDSILKPRGRLLLTAVTVETLYNALQIMQLRQNYAVKAVGIQSTRIENIGRSNMFQSQNQVLQQRKKYCFYYLGDSRLFSMYSYIMKKIKLLLPEVKLKIVPGITSFAAAAAYTNIPLAEGNEKLVIVPAVDNLEELKPILSGFSNVVLMKVAGKYEELIDMLTTAGLKDKAVYVSKIGYPDELITRDLDELRGRKRDYLSLIMIKQGVE